MDTGVYGDDLVATVGGYMTISDEPTKAKEREKSRGNQKRRPRERKKKER